MERPPDHFKRDSLEVWDRSSLERPPRALWFLENLLLSLYSLAEGWNLGSLAEVCPNLLPCCFRCRLGCFRRQHNRPSSSARRRRAQKRGILTSKMRHWVGAVED